MQARKVLGEIYERANQEVIEFVTTKQFLREWIQSKKATTAAGTSRRYEDTADGKDLAMDFGCKVSPFG